MHNGIVKWPLKRMLEEFMPKEFIYRKKSGFVPPFVQQAFDAGLRSSVASCGSRLSQLRFSARPWASATLRRRSPVSFDRFFREVPGTLSVRSTACQPGLRAASRCPSDSGFWQPFLTAVRQRVSVGGSVTRSWIGVSVVRAAERDPCDMILENFTDFCSRGNVPMYLRY